jgi:GTP cyclohydrolase I
MTSVDDTHMEPVGSLHLTDSDDTEDWQHVNRRTLKAQDWRRFEGYAREIFQAFGMNLDAPGTADTPSRYLKALYDATEGYEGDEKLVTAFPTECRGGPDCRISQVIEGPIPYHSLCEHHALPFFGHAYVGYIAHEHIIGISKLTRLVRLFARRFAVQERIGQQVAETLDRILQAHGVAVYLDGVHLCTHMRGVREVAAVTHTTFWRGNYDSDPALRAEFMSVCQRSAGRP